MALMRAFTIMYVAAHHFD